MGESLFDPFKALEEIRREAGSGAMAELPQNFRNRLRKQIVSMINGLIALPQLPQLPQTPCMRYHPRPPA